MALTKKAQKETDQAIRHLMDYMGKHTPWQKLMQELIGEMVEPVARQFDQHVDEMTDQLLSLRIFSTQNW